MILLQLKTAYALVIFTAAYVYGQDHMDVLKMENVEFPSSTSHPATFSALHDKEISEFTICMRFVIEFYNNNLFYILLAKNNETLYFLDRIGWETGMERDGLQGGVMVVQREIPGGGLAGQQYPWYHHYNIPKNIATSKESRQIKKE